MPESEVHTPRESTLSDAERAELVKQWTPLVHYVAYRYRERLKRWYEIDDLVSEGQLAIWDSAKWYDPALGIASFKTYAYKAVYHRYDRLEKYWRAKCRRDSKRSVSMDETYDNGEPLRQFASEDPIPDAALALEGSRSELLRAFESLNPRERRVLEGRFVDQRKLQAIADDFGVSRERIRQLESTALNKLRKALTWAYPELLQAPPVTTGREARARSEDQFLRRQRYLARKVAPPPESP